MGKSVLLESYWIQQERQLAFRSEAENHLSWLSCCASERLVAGADKHVNPESASESWQPNNDDRAGAPCSHNVGAMLWVMILCRIDVLLHEAIVDRI